MYKRVIFLCLLITCEAIADIFAVEWSMNEKRWWYALGALLSYLIANAFWLFSLKSGAGLARGSVIFSVASGVIATVIGYFLYKEHIGFLQWVGISLGILSITFLNRE